MSIRPADELGAVLSGRPLAKAFRERVEFAATRNGSLVVDFADVIAVSPSFVDEFFAKLPEDARERIEITNLSDDVARLVKWLGRR